MAFSMEYLLLFAVGCVGLYSLIFLSGSCWLMISMAHDLKCDLQIVADIEKPKAKLINEFSQFVEFHSDVMQLRRSPFHFNLPFDYSIFFNYSVFRLVRVFTNAYHITLMSLLLWTVGFLCGSLLLIQIELVEKIHLNFDVPCIVYSV